MKVPIWILLFICLATLVAGQEANRREKLRNLISAARSGDLEARTTLRNLRNKLKSRKATVRDTEAPVQDSPPPSFQTFNEEPQPEQREFLPQPQQPQPIQRTQRFRTQERQNRVRPQPESSFRQFNEPHRALNRGLEIDTRSEANAVIRVTNKTRTPPVETIRRYSYFDEEGNYIFGYEAADGSFKEEKRGLDCIVHGKYGYVDPDGIRREFTYTSGNKCDPNAPKDTQFEQPQPRNEQFLIQTQEERVQDAALPNLQFNRRRQPVQHQETQSVQPRRRPVQNQQTQRVQPRRRPVQNQETQRVHSSRQQTHIQTTEKQEQVSVQQSNFVEKAPQEPEVSVQPQPQKPRTQELPRNVLAHFQPAQFQQPSPPVFRPTPKPLSFNFDQEFKQIFSNFANERRQPAIVPVLSPQRPRTPESPPPPPPQPKPKVQTKPVKQFQQAPKEEQPRVPHQLVFDSATGTFTTVPLDVNARPNPVQRQPLPPPPPQQPLSSFVGKELPLEGFSPLPQVPLGALSFKGGINNAPTDFDNFFNQFNIK